MPSYSSHLIFNLTALSVLFLIYQYLPPLTSPQLALFLLFYIIGSVYITPDIDTRSESAKRCGVVCTPYRKIFKHRGISHHWLLGTVTRITYLLVITVFVVSVLGLMQYKDMGATINQHRIELLVAIAGMFLSNLFHILLDTVT